MSEDAGSLLPSWIRLPTLKKKSTFCCVCDWTGMHGTSCHFFLFFCVWRAQKSTRKLPGTLNREMHYLWCHLWHPGTAWRLVIDAQAATWLTWQDKWRLTLWHPGFTPAMTGPRGWQNTLLDFFFFFFHSIWHVLNFKIQYIIYMSYLKSGTSLIRRVSDAHMQKSSRFHVVAHTHTHACKHSPIFQIRLFHGSFPPSSPQKWQRQIFPLTRKGKEQIYWVESQNWVQIILLCQGSLDFLLPDLTFGVYPQDTNFALFLPLNSGLRCILDTLMAY